MRSIPPKNVVTHHLPYVLGMAPTGTLFWLRYDEFNACLVAAPICML